MEQLEIEETEEQQTARMLAKNPAFMKFRKRVEREVVNLERTQPDLQQGDRLALATKIALRK